MTPEETILENLTAKFPSLREHARITRARRIFVDVPYEIFAQVFDFAVKEMKFVILCTITGLDEGATLGVIYHLSQEGGIVINFHTGVPKEKPVLQTVTQYFPPADIYERELVDLLGMQVQGLPASHRYPLTDDWPVNEFPLRKDWKGHSDVKKAEVKSG